MTQWTNMTRAKPCSPATRAKITGHKPKDAPVEERERSPRRQVQSSAPTHTTKTWTRGGTIVPNLGKGNCLFHAMASALEDARPAEAKRSHRQLRAWLVALTRKNLSRYEAKWDRTDSKGVPTKQTFKEFIDLLANQSSWAGRFEAEIMAAALNLKLLVHTSWDEIMEINPEGKTSVCFYFDYQIGHWEFVKAADPKRWLQRKRDMAFSPEQVDSGNPGNFNQKRLRGGVHSLPRLTDFASSTCSRSVNGCDVRPRSRLGASHLLAINSTKRSRSRSSSSIPRLSNYASPHTLWKQIYQTHHSCSRHKTRWQN